MSGQGTKITALNVVSYFAGADDLVVEQAGVTKRGTMSQLFNMSVNSAGVVGVGFDVNSTGGWDGSIVRAAEIGESLAMISPVHGQTFGDLITHNLYYNAGWKFKKGDEASWILLDRDGTISMSVVSSGAADSIASPTTALYINNDAQVGINTSEFSGSGTQLDLLKIGANGHWYAHPSGVGQYFTDAAVYETSNFRYKGTSAAALLQLLDGGIRLRTASTGTAGNVVPFIDSLSITSSGTTYYSDITPDNNVGGTGAWALNSSVIEGKFSNAVSQNTVVLFNRLGNDGTIVSLRQDGTEEGTISVSGTTVSYNGAHISRWSQWYSKERPESDSSLIGTSAERPECLRGTVLSNRDEMCQWLAIVYDMPILKEDGSIEYVSKQDLYDGPLVVGDAYTETVVLKEAYEEQETALVPKAYKKEVIEQDQAGNYVKKIIEETKEILEPVFDEYPLYDERGKQIDIHKVPRMKQMPAIEEVITCTVVEEDNEQLNRVAVSNTIGDRNWAGVFQDYDEGDIYAPYDFYVARKGDFLIRVAAGVIVKGGDLLWSAGDGTAEPQPDQDVIGPWTLAKVATNIDRHVYPDGSRLIAVEMF